MPGLELRTHPHTYHKFKQYPNQIWDITSILRLGVHNEIELISHK